MLYLYGAGGHAKVVLETAEELNIPISGIIDEKIVVGTLFDYRIFVPGEVSFSQETLILSIGDNSARKQLAEKYEQKTFTSLVHPRAYVSRRAAIGAGSVVLAGVSINSSVIVGEHVIINTNSSVDHDCTIGDYVHIAPNACLAGNVTVGEGAFIGMGACVKQGIRIGKWAVIGAGSVVLTDVPDFSKFWGNPAKTGTRK
ncbi:acetyltransferase [Desertivirga xinjiangensis]|uniref:acetyltransferase n=1 Tax=Desertivirga xinjiangensis TaxID=539206 RepID=UPI00210B8269|nr:acetyltransferase [Pedobacter xinjiangensis]